MLTKLLPRCQRKYYRLTVNGKESNKAVTAVARELCCFIWGMATSSYDELDSRKTVDYSLGDETSLD